IAADTTQPVIARATALSALSQAVDPKVLGTVASGLNDQNPLMRLAALQATAGLPQRQRALLVAPFLSDTVRAVRVDAAGLRAVPPFTASQQLSVFGRAAKEFVDVQRFNAARADARTNLGTFYAEAGDLARAESELLAAVRLDPFFPPAYANLAD